MLRAELFPPFFSLFISSGAIWDNLQWLRWRATLSCLHTSAVGISIQVNSEGPWEGRQEGRTEGRKKSMEMKGSGNVEFSPCVFIYFFIFLVLLIYRRSQFTPGLIWSGVCCIYKSSNLLAKNAHYETVQIDSIVQPLLRVTHCLCYLCHKHFWINDMQAKKTTQRNAAPKESEQNECSGNPAAFCNQDIHILYH